MSRTVIYVHVNIILDFPIPYKILYCFANQNVHAYIKVQTVNMVVFFVIVTKIPT